MATETLGSSSDEEISFSEWQFVVKSNGECSDDESIEIIEREILRSVTSSSCSDGNDDEPDIVDWEVPVEDAGIYPDGEESINNPPSEIETCQIDTDQILENTSYISEESHATATPMNNFSRKVLYSCVIAAMISIIIHQYRGNLLDILLNRLYDTKSKVGDPSSQDATIFIRAELKKHPEDQLHSNDPVDPAVQDLIDKREQFKKLSEKYEMIIKNTFSAGSNNYYIDVSVLQDIFHGFPHIVNFPHPAPCNPDFYSIEPPVLCTDSTGKAVLFMNEAHYNELLRVILDAMQFHEEKVHKSLNNFMKTYSKLGHLEFSAFKPVKFGLHTENSNGETSKTETHRDNIQVNELINDITAKVDPISDSSKSHSSNDAESRVQEVIEDVRMLYKKIKNQFEDFHQLWAKCNKNNQDSCVLKSEVVSEQNDTFSNEEVKLNATHDEVTKSPSVSEFIYKIAPITDRWSLKMDSKVSADTDSQYNEKSNGEWVLKMGKAREKLRKRHKEKNFNRKTHKSSKKEEHELYKRYRAFFSQTREKFKNNYKKFSSHFKSKLEKFGDGMKRSYEKISSDWKHYAKSVFQTFHF
ncbi:uncharacterized protein LOC135831809 isoform X2 [Planococcus citri]|uniref:uncharacterized protein LOC135831809 isoform X2 n=1 Tax=Planococcus citri TaxID=170843 RepID=UPI0031F93DC4